MTVVDVLRRERRDDKSSIWVGVIWWLSEIVRYYIFKAHWLFVVLEGGVYYVVGELWVIRLKAKDLKAWVGRMFTGLTGPNFYLMYLPCWSDDYFVNSYFIFGTCVWIWNRIEHTEMRIYLDVSVFCSVWFDQASVLSNLIPTYSKDVSGKGFQLNYFAKLVFQTEKLTSVPIALRWNHW